MLLCLTGSLARGNRPGGVDIFRTLIAWIGHTGTSPYVWSVPHSPSFVFQLLNSCDIPFHPKQSRDKVFSIDFFLLTWCESADSLY
jgi:hypothetical protein